MELRHLKYFVAVAEAGSFSRAAEKLFIAQPPLSMQVRQLEQELGVALFVRHPKGVKLTAAGAAFLPEARYLLDRAGRAGDVARHAGDGLGGSLSMGFVPSASSTVLPEFVRSLRQVYPRLSLEAREMITAEQVEALVDGRIDIGIARGPVRHPRIIVAQQLSDPFCIAVPDTMADAMADAMAARPLRAVDLGSVAGQPFVAFTRHRAPAYFDQSIQVCAQAGFSPRIRYEASTVYGVLDLVSAGLGVALVPASAALLGVRGVVVCPLLRNVRPSAVLALIRRKADTHPMLPAVEKATKKIFRALRVRMKGLVGVGVPSG